jgi:predicted nucleic acid-binding protein
MPAIKSEKKYLLDTSALLALWNEEKGADAVEKLLQEAARKHRTVLVSFMTYMESYYRLWKNRNEETARDFYHQLKTLPVVRIDPDEALLLKAAELKATKSLSLADSWIIATGIIHQAVIVHKDPEFEQVRDLTPLMPLPYKV